MTSWIKVLTTLPRDKDILTLAREMGCNRHEALGIAVDWLCWLDDNSTAGETGLRREDIDSILCHDGFCEALEAVGWAFVDERGNVVAVDFDRHNGASAKKRAETARKVQKHRASNQNVTKKGYKKVTKGLPEEEEEFKKISQEMKKNPADKAAQMVDAAMTPETERRHARPGGWEEVARFMEGVRFLALTPAQIEECARSFYADRESEGWVKRSGVPIVDWKPNAEKYARNWEKNANRVADGIQAGRLTLNHNANAGKEGKYANLR